jgi:hypothetical protein
MTKEVSQSQNFPSPSDNFRLEHDFRNFRSHFVTTLCLLQVSRNILALVLGKAKTRKRTWITTKKSAKTVKKKKLQGGAFCPKKKVKRK